MRDFDELSITLKAVNCMTHDNPSEHGLTFSLARQTEEEGTEFFACIWGKRNGKDVQIDFEEFGIDKLDELITQFQLIRDTAVNLRDDK